MKNEDTITFDVRNSQSINKNKSNLLSLASQFRTFQKNDKDRERERERKRQKQREKEREKEIEIEMEREREKERVNYLRKRSIKKSKSPKTNNLSLKKVNETKFFTNTKISLPEISNYKKKSKSKNKSNNKFLDKSEDYNKTMENENSKRVLLTELNNNAYNKKENNNKMNINNKDGKSVSDMTIDTEKEKEIEDKLQKYKAQLNSNFIKLLEEGKRDDQIRYNIISNEKDPVKKKKLEEENAKEKMNLAKRLKEAREDLENKIIAYEKELRKNK